MCPTVLQDIKYASKDNFTGSVVTGYDNGVAILSKEAAIKLNNAQEELNEKGLSFLIWDAYRPVRAVNCFLAWRGTKGQC